MDSLCYFDKGTGTPLIFQHGLGASSDQAIRFLDRLEEHRVIGFDAPGHGKSPVDESTELSFNGYTDLAIKLLDSLNISSAIFGGISMGSGIAVNAALRYPDYVESLILVRPAWLTAPVPDNLSLLLEAAQAIRKEGKTTFLQNPDFIGIKEKLPAAAKSILGLFEDQQEVIPLVLESMVHDVPFGSFEELSGINTPTLVIGSEDDPLHPYWMAEKINEALPNSTIRKVTSRYMDDPQHIKESIMAIKEFINQQ